MAPARRKKVRSQRIPIPRSDHVPEESAAMQRPPAEVLYAAELERLRAADEGPRPPGWQPPRRLLASFLRGRFS